MAKINRVGILREACQIQVQSNVETTNAACEIAYTNVDPGPIACGVENISPFAQVAGRGYTGSLTHRFEIRWRPDIDIANLVLYKDQRFGIGNISDVNMKRQRLYLYCYIISDEDAFQNPSPLSGGSFGGLF